MVNGNLNGILFRDQSIMPLGILYNRLFSKQKFSYERQKLKFEELNFQRLQISKNFN